MASKLVTFGDIVDAIQEAVGIQTSDTRARNKIKRFVNMYYLDEVAPFKRWTWLEKSIQVIHKAYYNVATVAVTPESTTVTLSTAPNLGLGSFKGYRFSVDSKNQLYTISAHTAGSTTITLSSAYQEALNDEAEYKIWRDLIDLPTDAKETIELWHSEHSKPLDAVGSQGFRKLEAADSKAEGFPSAYNTWDFFNPNSPDAEVESDRYRQTRIYPSITSTPVTINVDYAQEVSALDLDADEPLMPIGDRNVIYYGAGAMAWSILNRNEEMHDRWLVKANTKLQRKAGDRDEGFDSPSLSPKKSYINNIRRTGLGRKVILGGSATSGSSVSLPTYLKDVVIDGATLRDDMAVDADVTIDGRDLSEDGIVLDSLVNPVEVTLIDNTSNQAAVLFDLDDYDVVHIQYSVKRDGEVEAGLITLTSNGTDAAISQGNISESDDVGVSFSTDVTGGNLRLLTTTTSTGDAATLKYRTFKWLG